MKFSRRFSFFLARHGESLDAGRFLGQADPPLSEQGRRQAHELAATLSGLGVERILSSSLRRASETAAILAERLGLPVEPDPRWNELGYGEWDGLAWEEIERRWPDQARAKLDDWWSILPPGGESRDAFVARVSAAWADLYAAPPRATLLVGHTGVNAFLDEMLETGWAPPNWEKILRFRQGFGGFTVYPIE